MVTGWNRFAEASDGWMAAIAIALGTFALIHMLRWVLLRQIGRIAGRTRTAADDITLDLIGRTKSFFILFVSLYAGARALPLTPAAAYALRLAGVFIVTIQIAVWGNALVNAYLQVHLQRRLTEDAAGATTMTALGYVIRLVFYVVLILVALDNLGIEIGALVTTLGIGGVAIALALQTVLGDLFGSLSIALDKPFVLGDFIVVGDMSGTVEHIGLKTTRVRSLTGEQLVLSNGDLLQTRIRNYQRMNERRVVLTLGVTYQTGRALLQAIPELLAETVRGQADTRFDRAHFNAYGPYSIDFELVYYVNSSDYNRHMDIKQAILLDIHEQFERAGIEFAYPTQTVLVSSP